MLAADRSLLLTAEEALLESVMWKVVHEVQDAGFVLKGGGALVRAYGLGRHSTDLDFDAERPTDLTRRVRQAAKTAGVMINEKSWWLPPDTGRTGVSRRLKVDFMGPNGMKQRLQIDTRFKPKPKTEDIVIVKGIRTYRPEAIYQQKLEALRERRAARDVFDLAFLTSKYGNSLSDGQIRRAETITRYIERLTEKLRRRIGSDRVLARITMAEDIVCEFRDAVDYQMKRRRILIQEQSVPFSHAMTEQLLELREILRGPEANRPWPSKSPVTRTADEDRRRDRQRSVDRDPGFYR